MDKNRLIDTLFQNPGGSGIRMLKTTKSTLSQTTSMPSDEDNGSRKLFVMRHGERIDFTFGDWTSHSFDKVHGYIQKDLNMPESLPQRASIDDWINDSPLTNIGLHQARLNGEYMKRSKVYIDAVYASPAFRCIQTAQSFLGGLGANDIPIRIEPGLFECLAWYEYDLLKFLSPAYLKEIGYNIDTSYTPYLSLEMLQQYSKESLDEFYARNGSITEKILQPAAGNVLLVAHATNLDTCTRFLVGKEMRKPNEIGSIMKGVPFCSLVTVEEKESKKWSFVEQPNLPCTHLNNTRFDVNVLKVGRG